MFSRFLFQCVKLYIYIFIKNVNCCLKTNSYYIRKKRIEFIQCIDDSFELDWWLCKFQIRKLIREKLRLLNGFSSSSDLKIIYTNLRHCDRIRSAYQIGCWRDVLIKKRKYIFFCINCEFKYMRMVFVEKWNISGFVFHLSLMFLTKMVVEFRFIFFNNSTTISV